MSEPADECCKEDSEEAIRKSITKRRKNIKEKTVLDDLFSDDDDEN